MKLAATLVAALVAFAAVDGQIIPDFGEGQLHDDIQYFLGLIPMEEVAMIVLEYASQDAEFQEALEYVQTDHFKEMMKDIQGIPSFLKFIEYMEVNGVYMYNVINKMNDLLDIPPIERSTINKQITGGLAGLFQDIKQHISYDLFIKGFVYKMKTSEAFRDFVALLKSPGHQEFIDELYKNERYLQVRGGLVEKGVDVVLLENIVYIVLGIEFPDLDSYQGSDLKNDLKEFRRLALTDEVVLIIYKYATTDAQVKKAISYAKSEEFHGLVRFVEGLREYQDLVLYLEKAGLNAVARILQIHRILEMKDCYPPKPLHGKYRSIRSVLKNIGGIKGMVDEVSAALPIEELEKLFEEKMRNSAAFQDFIKRLGSPEVQKIVDALYSHEVFLSIRQKAIAAGLDLDAIAHLINAILGLEFPKP